jgi:MoxR-like ATPase
MGLSEVIGVKPENLNDPENQTAVQILEHLDAELTKGNTSVVLTDEQLTEFGVKARYPALAVKRWKLWRRAGWAVRTAGNNKLVATRVEDDVNDQDVPKPRFTSRGSRRLKKDYFAFPIETPIVERALLKNKNVFLSGPTGCGKTELISRLADKNNIEYSRLNLNGEITIDDFLGVWNLIESDAGASTTEYTYGVLPQAMKNGNLLLLDELDAGLPEVLFVLQAVLEGRPLVLTKTGETIYPEVGFSVAATANTVGRGDMSSLYTGTRVMNEAFLDRFKYVLKCDYATKATEKKILINRTGISGEHAKHIVDLAGRCRALLMEGRIYSTFSTRKSIALAEAIIDFEDIKTALRVSVIDRVSDEDGIIINEASQRIWGIE